MDAIILGIDPGLNGALAWIHSEDRSLYVVEDMPVAGNSVNGALLSKLIQAYATDYAVVEMQSTRPGMGVSSVLKTGIGYGIVLGVLATLEIPTYHITPAAWKAHLRLSKDKELSRKMALDLWPREAEWFKFKKHENRAEAALIAVAWLGKQLLGEVPVPERRRIIRRPASD